MTEGQIKNAAAIRKLKEEEKALDKEMEGREGWDDVLKADLPSDMHSIVDGLYAHKGAAELPTDTQSLINLAAKGNTRARRVLSDSLEGRYEASPDIGHKPGGSVTGGYVSPNAQYPRSLEELRDGREYTQKTVDEFLLKITDPGFIPPGVALSLFMVLLTGAQPNFISRMSGVSFSAKAMALFYFFREAEAWTKVNILLGMRDWFVKKEDKAMGTEAGPFDRYMAPLVAAARAEDQRKAKAEEADV